MGSHYLSNSLVSGVLMFSLFSSNGVTGETNNSCASFWEGVSFSDLKNNPTDYLSGWQALSGSCRANDGFYERQLGYIYLAGRDFGNAEIAFNNASKMNPAYANDLSQLYMTQSQYTDDRKVEVELLAKAMRVLRGMVEVGNATYSVYLNLGSTSFVLEEYPDAIKYLKKSIDLQPTSEAFSLLGQSYFNLESYEDASKAVLKAFEMDNEIAKDENAMYVLAMSHVALRDYDNAKITLSLLSKTRPDLIGTETYQSVFNAIVNGFKNE